MVNTKRQRKQTTSIQTSQGIVADYNCIEPQDRMSDSNLQIIKDHDSRNYCISYVKSEGYSSPISFIARDLGGWSVWD